jgi:cyclopropane fatty-acyl-phospholipid synthase-like methyltransferase
LTAEEQPEEEAAAARKDEQEASIERTISLNERRLDAVFDVLKASGASRVLDLGCGEGKLLRRLLADRQFAEIVGMDVSGRVLDLAESRLKLDRLAPKQRVPSVPERQLRFRSAGPMGCRRPRSDAD